MKNRILSLIMPLLPKNDLSRVVGQVVHAPLPGPLGPLAVSSFAKFYNINLQEAELPISNYHSIGELFTRKLKPGVRPIASSGLVHPCDALITQAGRIDKLKLIQAKNHDYALPEFLRNTNWALAFEGGTYITYYLCPTDYHRVHSPVDGKVTWSMHVPGELWPVNEWSVETVRNLFSLNERVVAGLETDKGKAALVMVAATNVGNITMSFDENIHTNFPGSERAARERSYTPPLSIHRGDEIGVFHMGSTVVMLYEKSVLDQDVSGLIGRNVKMGAGLFA
jgi:phosphatidylserine decarboxylase